MLILMKEVFNKAILDNTLEGLKHASHEVELIDLNNEGFNPVFTREELAKYSDGEYLDPKVGEYLQKIKYAEHLVLSSRSGGVKYLQSSKDFLIKSY